MRSLFTSSTLTWLSSFGALALAFGCNGSVPSNARQGSGSNLAPTGTTGTGLPGVPGTDPPGTPGTPPTTGTSTGLAPGALRLLTNEEYGNTVQDLLGLAAPPSDVLQAENRADGYKNVAEQLTVSNTLGGQYDALASRVAGAVTDPKVLAPCAPGGVEAECATSFIQAFGKRAFRRTLSTTEVSELVALFTAEAARTNYSEGIRLVVETLLESPDLLYRSELGVAGAAGVRVLTPYEVASELSYLLSGSMPDPELLAAADTNALAPGQIETQARRLLAQPRAKTALRSFLTQWVHTEGISFLTKSPDAYPSFTQELWTAMVEENKAFIDNVLWQGDGTYKTLLSSTKSFVNAGLATHYGLPTAGLGTTLSEVQLNPAERAGLLTEAAVLAVHSKPGETDPIKRAKFVLTRLLCETLTPPPPALMVQPPPADPNRTTRERFAAHSTNPNCAGCHMRLDPVGFGLEAYDGIGRYQTMDNGKPVDTSGGLMGTRDIDGAFVGGAELGQKLSGSAEAQECLALQAIEWSFGRVVNDADRALAPSVVAPLKSAGVDVKEVFVAIAKSDAFTQRSGQ